MPENGKVMRTLIFDTETTDLIKNSLVNEKYQPRIIEFFGQVITDQGEIIEELEFFCNPGIPLSEEVQRITGIKPDQVKNEPPFTHFIAKVAALIESCDEVVAHNLNYDMSVTNTEFSRVKKLLTWPEIQTCTIEATEWIKGYRLNLNALHEHLFGEGFEGAHRARVDVDALTRCYIELKKQGVI